ncbi:hypothetical protein [Mesorhizobium sp. SP-1A]|uniref:hypothetical protein n=1 Tax=Mesorhizobium sp. SP-1A TaxID=3077840 RepID=UPI0028F74056|nr:hypothetical protein [Mesorhizobium sp. SP-1A]
MALLSVGGRRSGRYRGDFPTPDGFSPWLCPFMEDQPVEVVGDVGEDEFRLGPRQADGADEQAEAFLLILMRECVC